MNAGLIFFKKYFKFKSSLNHTIHQNLQTAIPKAYGKGHSSG